VEDLVRKGRDLEKMVLAQAVRWHLEGRVLVYGNKNRRLRLKFSGSPATSAASTRSSGAVVAWARHDERPG
jgi:hypothetical protein